MDTSAFAWLSGLINFARYTPTEVALFLTGSALWGVLYVRLIPTAYKTGFVEIPLLANCANVTWELLWGFVFKADMGPLLQWGYRAWAVLDAFLGYHILRYADRQGYSPLVGKRVLPIYGFAAACLLYMLWCFIPELDDGLGATSGYVLNVVMSSLYIARLFSLTERDEAHKLWWPGGLCRWIGSGLIGAFLFLHFPERRWLCSMAVVSFLLDGAMVVLQRGLLRQSVGRESAVPRAGPTVG